MDAIVLPPMDRRLQNRYISLVKSHMHVASTVASGPSAVLSSATALAQTQGMWRFLNNERVSLQALAEPPREVARQAVASRATKHVLLVHDWSKVDFGSHESKQDTLQLTHETDIGYELASALAVSAVDGSPLAPMQMHLQTAQGIHSTGVSALVPSVHRLERLLPTMEESNDWGLSAGIVHVIDREADSVRHMRCWDERGHQFLVRADDRLVLGQEQEKSTSLSAIVKRMRIQCALVPSCEVEYHGKKAWQFVAETPVTLHRPARQNQGNGIRRDVPGLPLTLRLVVAEVRDEKGKVLATWMLLTNVPESEAGTNLIALWYYWRWRIESFFKLLKSAGQQLEHWQQETGEAIARRLLVASMACVVVWRLERETSPQAEELKQMLVRLSGRQMKRSRPVTASALWAGLFVLLPTLELIEEYGGDLNKIKTLARSVLPFLSLGKDV
jgi:hypothetical protein